jgi:hypothetical protein
VLIAARIVDGSMWSKVDAPAIKEIRRRFDARPNISMAQ